MTTLLAFVVVLGVLIFVHELGHFLVARHFDVGVEKFSIGFGPKIFGWTTGRTDYRVSWIPLGGYVKMVGEQPDEELPEEDIPYSFTHKKVWQRMLIVAAGPVFNLVLAVVILWGLVGVYGLPVMDPVIGRVEKGQAAEMAGLFTGDRVTTVAGVSIDNWETMTRLVEKSKGQPLTLQYLREGREKSVSLRALPTEVPDLLGGTETRFSIGASPYIAAEIGYLREGMPADLAGLRIGDRVVRVNGIDTPTWEAMAEQIRDSEGAAIQMDVSRNGERHVLTMQPRKQTFDDGLGGKIERFVVGISPGQTFRPLKLGFFGSLLEGIRQTGEICRVTGVAVARMVTGTLSRDNLGGPIMIAQMAGAEAKKGFSSLLAFIATVSVNLALLNFLPVPVLDGGHLMFYSIELVTGKPVGLRGREIAQQVGIFLLLSLMVYTFYNDIMRLVTG